MPVYFFFFTYLPKDVLDTARPYLKMSLIPPAQRRRLLARANHACEACGAKPRQLHIHHTSRLAYWRQADRDLLVLCPPCHGRQGRPTD